MAISEKKEINVKWFGKLTDEKSETMRWNKRGEYRASNHRRA